jgi:hypothetical protein
VYQTLFNDHLEWVHAAPTTITAYSLAVRLTSGEPSYRAIARAFGSWQQALPWPWLKSAGS